MAPWHLFRGDDPRTSSEQEFLQALAAYITDWAVPGMPAQSFEVFARMHPLVVMTQVPGVDVPAGRCTLQIGYWDDRPGCRALEGEWGDDLLLDSHVYSSDGLTVFGLHEEPGDRKSTRLNSSHVRTSRMPSSA